MVPVTLSRLVISVVILSVRTFWMAGSWISGSPLAPQRPGVGNLFAGPEPRPARYPAAGVGYLVARPDAEHGDRGDYAAEDDEHDGDRHSPAEAPSACRATPLTALVGEPGRLGTQ